MDSVRGLIYWNDFGIIRKANLNGTGKKFVIETGKCHMTAYNSRTNVLNVLLLLFTLIFNISSCNIVKLHYENESAIDRVKMPCVWLIATDNI